MTTTTTPRDEIVRELWSDTRLVSECLKGNEEAWGALVDKYKRLIYSIPIKYGLAADDASDIFQSVCLEALSQLKTLRDPCALPKWLMQIAAHKTYRFRVLQSRSAPLEDDVEETNVAASVPAEAETVLREAEREQSLRNAIATLPPRCGQLLHMLFFEQPALPYEEVAKRLGLATGSIGFIRGRCLKRLRMEMESQGRP